MLDRAQCFDASRRREAREFGAFQLPYSMLRRDRSTRRGDEVVDHARDLLALRLIPVGRRMTERTDMKVDVPVTKVSEATGDNARERLLNLGCSLGDERRHVTDRDGDVVGQGL